VTFQRYPEPEPGAGGRRRSCGALPVGSSPEGHLLVPLAQGEAIWIGLRCELPKDHLSALVRFQMANRRAKPEVLAEIEHHAAIEGVPSAAAGSLPILRAPIHPKHLACSAVIIALVERAPKRGRAKSSAAPSVVEVRLTDYETFARETGLPAPAALDVASAFGGYLLP
jgi:hypothetical protein